MGLPSFFKDLNCIVRKSDTAESSSSETEMEEDVWTRRTFPAAKCSTLSYARELEEVFRRIDANGDGKITCAELGCILSSLGQLATPEELQLMVGSVDSDGDGCISLDEFLQLNTKGVDYGDALKDMRNAFFLYDADGDGFISCMELHRLLRKLGDSATMEDCRRIIRRVDRDGDGRLNFEDFKNMMMGRPCRISV